MGQKTGVLLSGRLMAVPAIANTYAAGTTTRFSSNCYAPHVIPRFIYSLIKLFKTAGSLDTRHVHSIRYWLVQDSSSLERIFDRPRSGKQNYSAKQPIKNHFDGHVITLTDAKQFTWSIFSELRSRVPPA